MALGGLKCRFCRSELSFDDVERNPEGTTAYFYHCPSCDARCFLTDAVDENNGYIVGAWRHSNGMIYSFSYSYED